MVNTFNFHIPLTKDLVSNSELIGVASTTSVDRDTERMSDKALKMMVNDIKTIGVNLFGNHEHQWENTLGSIREAELVDNKVNIKIKLDDETTNPKIPMLLNKLKRGIQLGLSVGGSVVDEKWENKNGKRVKIIDGVKLYEISVVGIPSNPDSFVSLPDSIAKSRKVKKSVGTCEHCKRTAELTGYFDEENKKKMVCSRCLDELSEENKSCPVCCTKIVTKQCTLCGYDKDYQYVEKATDSENEIALGFFGVPFDGLTVAEQDEVTKMSQDKTIKVEEKAMKEATNCNVCGTTLQYPEEIKAETCNRCRNQDLGARIKPEILSRSANKSKVVMMEKNLTRQDIFKSVTEKESRTWAIQRVQELRNEGMSPEAIAELLHMPLEDVLDIIPAEKSVTEKGKDMECPHCGSENWHEDEGNKKRICNDCGFEVPIEKSTEKRKIEVTPADEAAGRTDLWRCPECDKQNNEKDDKCYNCGYKNKSVSKGVSLDEQNKIYNRLVGAGKRSRVQVIKDNIIKCPFCKAESMPVQKDEQRVEKTYQCMTCSARFEQEE